jgi:hypothetical protein
VAPSALYADAEHSDVSASTAEATLGRPDLTSGSPGTRACIGKAACARVVRHVAVGTDCACEAAERMKTHMDTGSTHAVLSALVPLSATCKEQEG